VRSALRAILVIQMILARRVHARKLTRTLLVAATSRHRVSRVTAKRATQGRCVIDARKVSSVIQRIAADHAKAVTAISRESCQTSVMNSLDSATANRV
jgi:hypothetical protein